MKSFFLAASQAQTQRPAGDQELVGWDKTDVEQSISTRFEEQVIRHGTRHAVCSERDILTYDELNRLANSIARAILDRSGCAATGVALYMAHDEMTPAAALGVLKAAQFYIPLETDHPEDRNAFILEDSGAKILLTDRHNLTAARSLASRAGRRVSVLSIEETNVFPANNLEAITSAHDPCFVIYTSGSTGRPMGVCQLHRNILHDAAWLTNQTRIGPRDRMSLIDPLGAIGGMTALYAAILNGAAVLPFNVREDGLDGLANWVDREGISFLHAAPALFRRLCQYLAHERRRFEHVRLVRLGGEAITRTEWLMWRDHFPDHCQLLTTFRSIETLNFLQKVYDRRIDLVDDALALGDPIADMDIGLVDADGKQVGPDEVGEIVVRSKYLFPGYWKRPDLSERVLDADPLDLDRRFFKTGDLGCFAPDGRLFYVGRSDFRAKVGGRRVEMAEVEQALRRSAPIRDATVVSVPGSSKSVRLVAFAAIGGEAPPSRRELRMSLQQVLPDYMIPCAFIFVDELPLLAGGEPDRLMLTERAAGYSSKEIELFNRQVLLSALHETNSVAKLCDCLLDAGWQPPESGHLVVNPEGRQTPLFGVCGAFGHALRLLLIGKALGTDRPFHALQPPGMDWESVGCLTIDAMAAFYLAQIRRIQPKGPYHLFGTSFGGVVVFEMAIQLQRDGETVELLAMVDAYPPSYIGPEGVNYVKNKEWWAGMQTSDWLAQMGIRVAQTHRRALDAYMLRDQFRGTITYFWCEKPISSTPPARRSWLGRLVSASMRIFRLSGRLGSSQTIASTAPDRRSLWGGFASGGVRIFRVPGRHGNFHREPQFSAVMEGLRKCL